MYNPLVHDSAEQKRLQALYMKEWKAKPDLGFLPAENIVSGDSLKGLIGP